MRSALAFVFAAVTAALPAAAQDKYTGPHPEKPDFPYLLHAAKLVPTEQIEAREEKRKDGTAYIAPGASSSAKTPLAEPIFIFESKNILPDKLSLYKLDVKGSGREVFFYENPKKRGNSSKALRLSVNKIGPNLYRLEATEPLANGEYGVTPDGSNSVFCFSIY